MYSPITPVGRKYLATFAILLLLDTIVVALAARVNIYQEFFFMADIFPLGLSIATLVILFLSILADVTFYNSYVSRPVFKIGLCFVTSIFWLAFNIFSTSRWSSIPMNCAAVPDDLADERTWCEDVQALKAFVWIFFVGVLLTGLFVVRYAMVHHQRGNKLVWKYSLVRFNPAAFALDADRIRPMTSTDYFARSSVNTFYG